MAGPADESEMHLEFCRIPVIDLHYFSQDEINLAAQSAGDLRFDDVVIPKIDPSIFQESTASRKQTFSKLRLPNRREELVSLTHRRTGLLSVSRHPIIRQNTLNESEQKEAHRILELIQEFSKKAEHTCQSAAGLNVLNPPPLNKAFPGDHLSTIQENLHLEVGNCLQLVSKDSALYNENDANLASRTVDIDGSMALVNVGLDSAKKKIRTKEGARRKAFMNASEAAAENIFLKVAGNSAEDKEAYWFTSSDNKLTENTEEKGPCSNDKVAIENNGVFANDVSNNSIWPFAPQEPFVPQLKRKFSPLATEAEVRDFFKNVGGQWASKMKKRKIVDAEDFGEGFPKGWKLLLGVRKKDGRFLIECRKYISPDGLQFASCREVSAYVLSTLRHSPAGVIAAEQASGSSPEHRNSHQALVASIPASSMGQEEHSTEGNLFGQQVDRNATSTASLNMGNDEKLDSLGFNGHVIHRIEKQQTWKKNVSVEKIHRVDNPRKRHHLTSQNTPMNCKKCNVRFSNRSTFMAHLTIHHVKKKKTVADKSIAHGVIVNNGKYECQICHKVFDEKNRYTGHVGVHARKNIKKLRVPLKQSSIASKTDLGNTGTCNDKMEEDIKDEINEKILETKVSDEQDGTTNTFLTLLGGSSTSEENGLGAANIAGFLSVLDSESGKDQGNYTTKNQKLEGMTDFEQIQMYIPSPKFSFETGQDGNSAMGAPIELGLDANDLPQVVVPPEQFGWEPFLSEKENSCSQYIVCIWCNTEFSQDGIDQDLPSDSVGLICPVCKTKISGQADIDNELENM